MKSWQQRLLYLPQQPARALQIQARSCIAIKIQKLVSSKSQQVSCGLNNALTQMLQNLGMEYISTTETVRQDDIDPKNKT